MSQHVSSESTAYHPSPIAGTLGCEESPAALSSPDGVLLASVPTEEPSMDLLRLEDVFFGGTEEERQE